MGSQSEAWLSMAAHDTMNMFILCPIHGSHVSLNGNKWENSSRNILRSKTEVIWKVTSLLKTYVL